jgi:hypothetical protein
MKMIRHIVYPAIVVTLLISVVSCTVQTCYDDTDPLMNTLLLTSGTGLAAKADSLRVIGLSETSEIEFVHEKSVSGFSVPLDPGNDITTFRTVINGTSDTVVIRYTRRPHLVAPECGYTILSSITSLQSTHHIIDTLIINSNSVDLNGEKNLHLFY